MIFLQGHGISPSQAARIYKRYGDSAVAILRKNPYQLAEEIAGIGFAGADKIAANLDIAKDAPQRLQAGILHVLQRAAGVPFLTLSGYSRAQRPAIFEGVPFVSKPLLRPELLIAEVAGLLEAGEAREPIQAGRAAGGP